LQASDYLVANATIAINANGINSELAEPAASSIVDATTGASMTGSLIPPAKAVVVAAAKTVAKISFFILFSIRFGSHASCAEPKS
jgi:hypothetical protein